MPLKTLSAWLRRELPDYATCARVLMWTLPLAIVALVADAMYPWEPNSESRMVLHALIILLVVPFLFGPLLMTLLTWINVRREAILYQVIGAGLVALIPFLGYAAAGRAIAEVTGTSADRFDNAAYYLAFLLGPVHVLDAWAAYYGAISLVVLAIVGTMVLVVILPFHLIGGLIVEWKTIGRFGFQLTWFLAVWIAGGWIMEWTSEYRTTARRSITAATLHHWYTAPITECQMPPNTSGRRLSDNMVLWVNQSGSTYSFRTAVCEPCFGLIPEPGQPRVCET